MLPSASRIELEAAYDDPAEPHHDRAARIAAGQRELPAAVVEAQEVQDLRQLDFFEAAREAHAQSLPSVAPGRRPEHTRPEATDSERSGIHSRGAKGAV